MTLLTRRGTVFSLYSRRETVRTHTGGVVRPRRRGDNCPSAGRAAARCAASEIGNSKSSASGPPPTAPEVDAMGCCFSSDSRGAAPAFAGSGQHGGGQAAYAGGGQAAYAGVVAAPVVAAPTRTWGVQPSGVWDKATMLQQIRNAARGNTYDNGDESEGKGGRLWQCPNRAWVNVWNNDIRRLSLRMAPNLIYLDVSNNDIRTLEEVAGGQSLVYLDASSNDIGRGGRLGLPVGVVMACLEGLNLANNDIGPHIPAGAMDWCPNVRAVSLNDNDIESFPDDPMWPQLQVLNLANNNLVTPPDSLHCSSSRCTSHTPRTCRFLVHIRNIARCADAPALHICSPNLPRQELPRRRSDPSCLPTDRLPPIPHQAEARPQQLLTGGHSADL